MSWVEEAVEADPRFWNEGISFVGETEVGVCRMVGAELEESSDPGY